MTSNEPKFIAVARSDEAMLRAHAVAADTLHHFAALVSAPENLLCSVKLRFRDPDLSEELGEDQFLYLWLTDVVLEAESGLYSALFFEVPETFTKWHQCGQRLAFEPEDIFDWMANDEGTVHGGFTLRVTRSRLPEAERPAYDAHVGATAWHPLPDTDI